MEISRHFRQYYHNMTFPMFTNSNLAVSSKSFCSVLNKLTLQKSKIKMKYSKKKYNYYSDDER
ncbi:MAG: hypothetical protein KHY60_20265, partial [Bacteroides thetaiotaomicron]|nr:hypothetical protein [Bacteroides thetaiotaomicron]